MTIVQPTILRVLRLWIAIAIRALLLGIGASVTASIVIGIGVASTGGGQAEIEAMAKLVGPLIGLPVSLYSAYAQLGRKCGDFRLVLIAAD